VHYHLEGAYENESMITKSSQTSRF